MSAVAHRLGKRIRKKMTQEQRRNLHEVQLDRFSASFPKNHPVWHWTQLPFGPVVEAVVWSDPFVDQHGDLVVYLTGVGKPVSIHTISEIDEDKRPHVEVRNR